MDGNLGEALRRLTESVIQGRSTLGHWSDRPLVLCLSGGTDSSALAFAVHRGREEFPGGVQAAHVMHHLRGTESDGDATSVRELCGQLGLPLTLLDAIVEPGPNLEERARDVRYATLRQAFPHSLLATAHHLDDQSETVVLRLLRGAGARGLGGIARLRDDGIWRPFLSHSRSTLEAACTQARWTARIDSSNLHRTFARNRIRLDFLPGWEAQEPGISRGLASLAESAQALAPFLERGLDRLASSISLEIDLNGFSLDLSHWPPDRPPPHEDPELDLLLERSWTRTGRRPWAKAQRLRLLQDASGRSGKRTGGQSETAVYGGGRLRVEASHWESLAPAM